MCRAGRNKNIEGTVLPPRVTAGGVNTREESRTHLVVPFSRRAECSARWLAGLHRTFRFSKAVPTDAVSQLLIDFPQAKLVA